ncbi:methionine ABC transporter permease [Parablautia muri]|uniref:ABC transporter permease n=1 Tax=Parablautia muri TaxID=2320879 RepID=A0A9X5GS42_9FIRM|nr:methionine ABC transporter permease [Parablautia muri]NBJ92605.1 ABC transporter permease [Parablautia muri]
MSLYKYSFFEVLMHSFSAEVWAQVLPAISETMYMVGVSSIFVLVFGIILGLVLVMTSKEGLVPCKVIHTILGAIINCFRSLPQVIIIIVMLPVARALVGKSYGSNACIISLVASCVPLFARLVESSLLEIDKGKIEAAKAMGSGNMRILFTIMVPETLPSLIRAFTNAVVIVISMTALAGSFGAGGIGYIAVTYGYTRFQHDLLFATIIVLIVIVQAVQIVGDTLSKIILKKRHLI